MGTYDALGPGIKQVIEKLKDQKKLDRLLQAELPLRPLAKTEKKKS